MDTIVVEDLGKRFGGGWAIEGLTFTVARGEVFGLLGPNGAGKTTTLRILAGLYAPDAGGATVAGLSIDCGTRGAAALRAKVGLLTEQPGFYDRLPVAYNLIHFARLYGVPQNEAKRRCAELLSRFGLAAVGAQPFAILSRGMKQKLAIARAILHEPEVVLLDEPTVGLDPEATLEVRSIIAELAARGRTIVLCTHQLSEVERLCSRAAVLAGRLVGVHEVVRPGINGCRIHLGLETATDGLAALVSAQPWAVRAAACEAGLEVELEAAAKVPDLIAMLVAHGARLTSVNPARDVLEETYLRLVAEARDAGLVS